MPSPRDARVEMLLRQIDQGYDQKAWHGPNLKSSLRGVTAEQAAWRPEPGRHNIWELAVHAAYWKYRVQRRLLGLERKYFPLKGSNFFERPEGAPSEAAWKEDRTLLEDTHRQMRETVEALDPESLHEPAPGGEHSRFDLVFGIAAHDIYHAGQIRLLRRLRVE